MSATGTQTDDVIGPVILLARATRVVAMYRGSTDQSTQTQLRWLRSAGRWQLGDDSEESEEDGDESATDSEAETPSDTEAESEAESEAGAVEAGRWQRGRRLTPILEAKLAAGRWQLGDDSEESEEDGDESATDSEGETPSDPWTVVDFCNTGPWTVVDFCNTENVVRIAY